MDKKIKNLFLSGLFFASCSAYAAGPYIGLKIGTMNLDEDGFEEALNAGVLIGYEFSKNDSVSWSAEVEFTNTLIGAI